MKKDKNIEKIFKELIAQNKSNYVDFYKEYKNLIYGIAFSILKNKDDSEDVVQNVFVKIYNAEPNILPSKNQLSWLYIVTKNEALQIYKKRNKLENLEILYEIPDNKDYILEDIDKIEYNKLIQNLPSKQKEVISLKILGNLTFNEIANLLNESENTIKWRYYKATHSLKIIITNLSLFICTLVLGIHNYTNSKKINAPETISNENINMLERNDTKTDNSMTDKNSTKKTEESKSIYSELKDTTQNSTNSETKNEKDEMILNSNQNTIENTIIENNDIPSMEKSTICFTLSFVFLILIIIFSIFLSNKPTKIRKKLSK